MRYDSLQHRVDSPINEPEQSEPDYTGETPASELIANYKYDKAKREAIEEFISDYKMLHPNCSIEPIMLRLRLFAVQIESAKVMQMSDKLLKTLINE